jgi:hypothetical protein
LRIKHLAPLGIDTRSPAPILPKPASTI